VGGRILGGPGFDSAAEPDSHGKGAIALRGEVSRCWTRRKHRLGLGIGWDKPLPGKFQGGSWARETPSPG